MTAKMALRLMLLTSTGFLGAATAEAQPPALSLPVQCTPGSDCWLVNYFDHDPGSGFKDYSCGWFGYDGHKGTDIAVRSVANSHPVLAAASGTVKGLRDGTADSGTPTDGQECGNGVVLQHDDNWQTQYCHLKQGSLRVRSGQQVKRGDVLGMVGKSGDAAFPHLHLSLRQGDTHRDPFNAVAAVEDDAACSDTSAALWDTVALEALRYPRQPVVFASGLSDAPPDWDAMDAGSAADAAPLSRTSPALLLWARAYQVPRGGSVTLTLLAPDGSKLASRTVTAERNKMRMQYYVGKKRPANGWQAGTYTGMIEAGGKTTRTSVIIR